jgi:hypothetical protein
MPLITSSLKTMRIHSRPPAAFLQAYREARAEGEMLFSFSCPVMGFEFEYSGLLFDVDSPDKENDDDIKIVVIDFDAEDGDYDSRNALSLVAHDKELQWFLRDILVLFSHEEPDYIFLSASAGAAFDESEPSPNDFDADPYYADSVGDKE